MPTRPNAPRPLTAALAALAFALASLAAHATPRVGGGLPPFTVDDLTGAPHDSRELRGRPTLVLVMTDLDADPAMRRWGAVADRRVGAGVRRVQLVSVGMAFFLPTAAIRAAARDRAPASVWRSSWFDRHGDVAELLGLAESETPYAVALDAQGRVRAVAHCEPGAPEAERVWEAVAP